MSLNQAIRLNCYNLSKIDDGDIVNWSPNKNISTVIEAMAYPFLTGLIYTKLNDTDYQWCGPMLLIVEGFAKWANVKIQIFPMMTMEQMVEMALVRGLENMPHFIFGPTSASHYFRHVVEVVGDEQSRLSTAVAYLDPSRIMARTMRGEDKLYKQFQIFNIEVYYGIILSMFVMSSVIALQYRSMKTFFANLWAYFSVIVSDSYTKQINTRIDRLLSGVWLMTCTVLLSAFAGLLRDQALKEKPVYWIDSWDDLYRWKHVNIQTTSASFLINFIKEEPNHKFSSEFRRRLEIPIENVDLETGATTFDYDRVVSGELAIATNLEYMQIFKKNLVVNHSLQEDVDFHISSEGDASQPYFIQSHKVKVNQSTATILDKVITILRESGIYTEMRNRVLNSALNTMKMSRDFPDLHLEQLAGISYLYAIFNVISVAILFIEFSLSRYQQIQLVNR